jgi:hypothetical protein
MTTAVQSAADIVHYHLRTTRSQHHGVRPTETTPASGDDGDAIIEPDRH